MLRKIATLASIIAVAGIFASSSSQAASPLMPMTTSNNLTISNPVGLPGVTLTAGTYVFESGIGGMDRNIVRVLSRNRQRLFYQGFTVPTTRRFDAEKNVLTFGETTNGAPAPILAWYPVGSNSGHAFMYR
jgi:hypothetical protein